MQVSHILRALPVVLCLATPHAAAAQTRYRITAHNTWFHQEPGGRRLARLARGATVTGGATRDAWVQVALDGWIFAASVGPSPRPDFDLLVTRAPNENLRAMAGGTIVAELAQGFGLKRLGPDSAGRWVHVTREGWVQRGALTPHAEVVATRTAADSDTAATPRGVSDSGARPVDSSRAQPVRMTTLYRAPDGPEAGTVAAETPLRVVGRSGDWARVQFEGWVKGGELQAAPSGVMVGVTAAELRTEPQRYVGQVLRWRLEFIAVQKADDLRPDISHWRDLRAGAGTVARAGLRVCHCPRRQAARRARARPARHHADHRTRAQRPQPLPWQSRCGPDLAGGGGFSVNDVLAERVRRKLDAMPDEQAYQVLDYIEFLESKYAQRAAGAPAFQKVAETLEDTLRAGRVPVTIIRGTMDAVGKAGKFLEGLAAAGKAAVEEATKKPVEETKPPQ